MVNIGQRKGEESFPKLSSNNSNILSGQKNKLDMVIKSLKCPDVNVEFIRCFVLSLCMCFLCIAQLQILFGVFLEMSFRLYNKHLFWVDIRIASVGQFCHVPVCLLGKNAHILEVNLEKLSLDNLHVYYPTISEQIRLHSALCLLEQYVFLKYFSLFNVQFLLKLHSWFLLHRRIILLHCSFAMNRYICLQAHMSFLFE